MCEVTEVHACISVLTLYVYTVKLVNNLWTLWNQLILFLALFGMSFKRGSTVSICLWTVNKVSMCYVCVLYTCICA